MRKTLLVLTIIPALTLASARASGPPGDGTVPGGKAEIDADSRELFDFANKTGPQAPAPEPPAPPAPPEPPEPPAPPAPPAPAAPAAPKPPTAPEVPKPEDRAPGTESTSSSASTHSRASESVSSTMTNVNGKSVTILRRRDADGKETITVMTMRDGGKPRIEELTPEEYDAKYGHKRKKRAEGHAPRSGLPPKVEKKSPESPKNPQSPASPGRATE